MKKKPSGWEHLSNPFIYPLCGSQQQWVSDGSFLQMIIRGRKEEMLEVVDIIHFVAIFF